jgi:RIO kinase 2
MYMSRLAAIKEFTFMKSLRENSFPVPEPISQSRHTIVMSLIDAFPLRQISSVPDPAALYAELISMILRLAQYGLIHGDFNEFNILIEEKTTPASDPSSGPSSESITLIPILIDFPQMISMDHTNAEMYFDRDVNCIKRFFQRRFHFTPTESGPFYADARKLVGRDGIKRLDVAVEASGFSRKMAKELEAYMKEVGVDGDGEPGQGRAEEVDGEREDEEEDDDAEEEEEEDDDDEASDNNGNGNTVFISHGPEADVKGGGFFTDALGNTQEGLAQVQIEEKA